jgi:hypothetical protein
LNNKETKKQRPVYKTIPLSTAGKSPHPEGEGSFEPILDFRLRLRCLVAWLFISQLRNLGSMMIFIS